MRCCRVDVGGRMTEGVLGMERVLLSACMIPVRVV